MPAARITSTMQDDFPLTITTILQHGARVFGRSECVTWQGGGARHASYREIEQNARRLASALTRLGVGKFDKKVLRARYRSGDLDVKRTRD